MINIKISPLSSINPTTITVTINDPTKVKKGEKILSNNQASADFQGKVSSLGALFSGPGVEAATKASRAVGQTFASASTGIFSLTSVFGVVLGMVGKFF